MDRQNQYCESVCTTKSNLYVQCNPYKNSDILYQDRKVSVKVLLLEAQKTSNNQIKPEPKQQHWRYHNTWLQTILQSIVIKTAK
jgi:hypothetical protein